MFNRLRVRRAVIAGVILAGACQTAALADSDFIKDTDQIGKSKNGIIMSDQLLELGMVTPSALRLEGEQSIRMGNLERAIMVLQRSVELAPLDIDGRILYATALEKKLMKQKRRDPRLFNYTVKQWLFIYKKADFDDHKMMAANHLVTLVGRIPKWYEKEKKYLAKVLIPEDGSVKVSLGKVREDKKSH